MEEIDGIDSGEAQVYLMSKFKVGTLEEQEELLDMLRRKIIQMIIEEN